MNKNIIREFEEIFEDARPYDLEKAEIECIQFSDLDGLTIEFKPETDDDVEAELTEKWTNEFYRLVKKYKLSKEEIRQVVSLLWQA